MDLRRPPGQGGLAIRPRISTAITHRRAWLFLVPAIILCLLAAGCGGAKSQPLAGGGTLTVGYVGWADSVAVANLTRAVLEQNLDYDVKLRRFDDPEAAVIATGEGEIDVFYNVWMPDHEDLLGPAEGETVLDPWLTGMTRSGIAAPSYMDVGSIEGMKRFEDAPIIAIEPGLEPGNWVSEAVAERMPEREISYLEAPAMRAEVERLYTAKKPFFFTAYSPHWMDAEYEFEYLVDPEDEMPAATQPMRVQPVVNEDLREKDPLAYSLVNTLQLSGQQVSALELSVRDAGSPRAGVEAWLEDRDWLARSWIGIAKRQAGED